MIIALAGRRIDASDAEITRFPLDDATLVRERVYQFLIHRKATALVCSAACGADLLALDVAGELGIERYIILPFAQDRFRTASVTDRPGEWGTLFDRITKEVQAAKHLMVLSEPDEDNNIFITTNKVILDKALTIAQQAIHNKREQAANSVLAVLVWDGQSRGQDDLTANFADEARMRGIPVFEITTVK